MKDDSTGGAKHLYFGIQEQAAIFHAERLARDVATQEAASVLLRVIDNGIDDDAALADALAPTGATPDALYADLETVIFRDGKRVIMPSDPCPRFLGRADRPCIFAAGHGGSCRFADAPIRAQREAMAEFEQDLGAVVVAVAGVQDGGGK